MKTFVAVVLGLFAVATATPVSRNNPEEAGYYQGDIVNGGPNGPKLGKNGIIDEQYRWLKNGDHYEVPYVIDESSLSK